MEKKEFDRRRDQLIKEYGRLAEPIHRKFEARIARLNSYSARNREICRLRASLKPRFDTLVAQIAELKRNYETTLH